ncbi:hypothetical protein HYR69_03100, partial [Candidatus Sumerlaeota bacterium]|nr:hypothetical protein [Candidatus Sumerlaeota bacterium]
MNTSSPQSKISPARRAVLAALARIGEFRVPSDFGSEHPGIVPEFVQLDPRERAFAERIYRGVLQNLRLIDELTESRHLFDPRKTDKLLRWLMRIAIYQRLFMGGVPDYAIGRQTVDHARELCGEKSARFMNAIIRRLFEILPRDCGPGLDQFLRAWSPSGIPPAIRYSLPDTISEVLASGYGAELLTPILRSFNDEETRVWIRANPLRASGSDLQARLRLEGVETESLAGAGGVFRWVKTGEFPQPPWRTECWKEGLLTVQDLGAMTAVWLLQPTAGQRILDFCAAPGGKTGQMWE